MINERNPENGRERYGRKGEKVHGISMFCDRHYDIILTSGDVGGNLD
jgi:hypothetical protein